MLALYLNRYPQLLNRVDDLFDITTVMFTMLATPLIFLVYERELSSPRK